MKLATIYSVPKGFCFYAPDKNVLSTAAAEKWRGLDLRIVDAVVSKPIAFDSLKDDVVMVRFHPDSVDVLTEKHKYSLDMTRELGWNPKAHIVLQLADNPDADDVWEYRCRKDQPTTLSHYIRWHNEVEPTATYFFGDDQTVTLVENAAEFSGPGGLQSTAIYLDELLRR